jgi:hypothetical protein
MTVSLRLGKIKNRLGIDIQPGYSFQGAQLLMKYHSSF